MTMPRIPDTRRSYLRVRDVDLYCEDTGGEGEPILFLHGFFFDGRMYEAQIAALRDRYRCLTLDFRGQGRSGHARTGFQLEQLTADVLTVIRRLDLAPAHLVGLSMGGFVGMRIGAREPDLLRSLTLLNTGATPHPPVRYPLHLALTAVAGFSGRRRPSCCAASRRNSTANRSAPTPAGRPSVRCGAGGGRRPTGRHWRTRCSA
ncbi:MULTISPECIES: alpha/beta fold hydrolase [Rhodococcus]|uniref:alpha/beta fold hydrolase n=1 Tax=Rhodococcus TaxID=1827 RepID=UPI000B1D1707|nr:MULTISPECIES: alpha/beta hydrolase [Rhodococcus]MDO2381719.1 alpha/beta hydrolase [Rhodococcus ruber]UIR38535.1 alpha/beta hydrolase [Rhodococcus sp. DMF-1]